MQYTIRVIEKKDNKKIETVIRSCLMEFGAEGVCELQKMYCLPEVRGTGVSHALMDTAIEYAKKYYAKCYLETLENMVAAQRFYEKYGFTRTYDAVARTEHFACDVHYIKDLA